MDVRSLYRAAKTRKGVGGVLKPGGIFYVSISWMGRRRPRFTDAIVSVVARKPGSATPGAADAG